MSGVNRILKAAIASAERRRQRRDEPTPNRSRGALMTVPIVVVSTLAISLNLAAPVQAATLHKKPLKSKLVETTPKDASVARTAVAAAAETAPANYLVVDGDTVSSIAGRFGLSTASVLALNGLGWSSLIFPGQELKLTSSGPVQSAPQEAPASSGDRKSVV